MDIKKGYKACAKFIRIAPSKVRPLANIVRNKKYTDAIPILDNFPNKGARLLKKVIQSAAANALYNNDKLDEDMIIIKDLQVNDAPRMKRMWIRARGRADRLLKRLCHISVILDEIEVTGVK